MLKLQTAALQQAKYVVSFLKNNLLVLMRTAIFLAGFESACINNCMHQERILNPFGVSESSFCIVLSYVITMHMKTLKYLALS